MASRYVDSNKPVKTKPKPFKLLGHTVTWITCDYCDGRGEFEFSTHYTTTENCSTCNSAGYVPDDKTKEAIKFMKKWTK